MRTIDIADVATEPMTDPPVDVLQLIYRGNDEPHTLDPARYESAVVEPLLTAFSAAQHHWESITAAQSRGRIIVVAPAVAALGDPARPLDAAVVGGLISFVRSVAIELHRSGATANILFFDTAPDDHAVAAMVATLVETAASSATGQEIYLAGGSTLGKLRP